ncbi:hypothetical protein BGW38_009413 [Lunasporangiospora selenospora]|uniref:Uncharacterized protein n=1 Tax=Lunasporangiospora selenospora TaxID=979761 RepID=A0A9P6KFY6_9FUNG|nr:hypothetical protein BGW38_009413 [Lunasporangiospora selenospora]
MSISASARPTSPIPTKKSNSRLSSRTTRSKSDSSSFHEAVDPRSQPPAVEKLPTPPSRIVPPTLPSFGASSAAEDPIILSPPPAIVKTSLLPPPRQSWNRAPKSSRGGNHSGQIPIAAIDTKLANEVVAGSSPSSSDPTGAGPAPGSNSAGGPLTSSSSIANLSFSSSSSSPRATSPDFLARDLPQSPMSYSAKELSRTSRDRARSPRLEASYHQRSVDNLSAAYFSGSNGFYSPKRMDLGQSSPSSNQYTLSSTMQHGNKLGITVPSSLMSSSPPSPLVKNPSGGVGHHHSSHSIAMDGSKSRNRDSTYSIEPHYSCYDSSRRVMVGGSSGDTNSGRSSSLTTERTKHLLDDDPWTQALVNRAQAQSMRSTGNAQYGSRTEGDQASNGGDSDRSGRPAVARTASE